MRSFPADVQRVALQKKQFSAWNSTAQGGNDPKGTYPKSSKEFQQARTIAADVVSGRSKDPTGGALSPVITGSLASAAIDVDGYGTVNAVGYPVGSIPAGQARVIPLDSIKRWLEGVVTITGGTGLVASFLKYT